eukprot:355181-Chlamydomonas_euryale.AAC.9
MRFTTTTGQPVVVERRFQLTQKKSTMTFKTLDSLLSTHNRETNEKQSVTCVWTGVGMGAGTGTGGLCAGVWTGVGMGAGTGTGGGFVRVCGRVWGWARGWGRGEALRGCVDAGLAPLN